MATEKIQTELVITNLAHGQSSQQDLQSAIQAQQLLSTGPRKQLGQALAGSGALGDETQLLNALARMLRTRAGSTIRTTGTPVPTGRYRTNRQGEVMLDPETGEPLQEMQTPTVSARVRSDPNAHLSEAALRARKHRMMRKLYGSVSTPSEEELVRAMGMSLDPLATEDEMIEAQDIQDRYAYGKRDSEKQKKQRRRRSLAARREELMLESGLLSRDPVTGQRAMPEQLSAEDQESLMATLRNPNADDGHKLYARSRLAQESQRRAMVGVQYRADSRYDEKALKDISQIEKDIEATRKRLDTGKMRERLDAANAKLSAQPGAITRAREQFLDYMSKSALIPLEGRSAAASEALRRQLTPLQEREMRFRDKNQELDDKVAAYRKLSRDERVAPEGREALAEIKKDKGALKEEAKDLAKEQSAEEERQRLANKARADRYQTVGRMFAQGGSNLFDPDKSIATTGLLSAGQAGASIMQQAGYAKMLSGGGAGMLLGGFAIGGVLNALSAGLQRGTELQKSAEKVYTASEPMFAREEQMRAARGIGDVRSFSLEAQTRAEASRRRLGTPDRETAASGTPENADVYSDLTTKRLKTLQQFLGHSMGLSAATQAYGQFRRQAGVTDMSTETAAEAMQTGLFSGVSTDLLARATQLGAIRGNRGGGPRRGLDQRLDMGTLRYQQETLERAGLTGAPAEAILGQTLSRQETMASMGLRTDFDRDAKFQRVLQEQGIAPQQFGGITGGVDEARMGLMQQLQAPGKEILSGLMMAEAFRRGKTVTGAAEYLAKNSSAELLENQMKGVGPGSGLLPFVAMSMAPADQPAMMEALKRMRQGQTAGPAAATGEGTIDAAATERGRLEYMPEFSALGAQRSMGNKAEIAEFQQTLDSAAKSIRAAADSMQSVAASAGNFFT
jgi:hypothetical protein